jgi:outer membrane protein
VVILALVAVPATAQQPTAVPARLTLEDAIAIARERSPELAQARNSLNAQGAQVRAGFGAFLPTLRGQVDFGGQDYRSVSAVDPFGNPLVEEQVIRGQRSWANQGLYAGLTLFDGLGNVREYSATKASYSAAEEAQLAVQTRVDAEITRRFYDAVRTRQLIALEERLLASAREQRDNMTRRFRTAGATQEDLLGAEADVASQELQLARAEGDAEKAVLAVREQLALTEPIVFEVTGELPAAWDPAAVNADSLVALAIRVHPDIARLDATASAAHYRASAARGGYWPTVRLGASVTRSVNASGYDALFDVDPENRTMGFSLSFDWPLFQGFQTRAQVSQASADALNAEEALRAGKLAREREVRAALIDLQNAYRGVALAERAAELSNERLRLSRERYAIGGIDFATLQILIDRAAQEERQVINARYAFAASQVALVERVGRPLVP